MVLALIALVACAQYCAAGVIQIDSFATPSDGQFFILGKGTDPSKAMGFSSPDILGGQRDTLVNVFGQGTPTSVVGLIGHDTDYNINALQVGTNGAAPTVVTLLYDGLVEQVSASALTNAHALVIDSGFDLTDGGSNAQFLLHFFSVDARPTVGLDVKVTITSPGGLSSTATVDAQNSTTGFDLFIPFNLLVGNASVTNVDSIQFAFNSVRKTPNVDYEVQLLAAVPVPEPSALVLGSMGLAAALAVCRRRRRAKPLA